MKTVLQRVTSAAVGIDGERTAEIGGGFLVLLGVCEGDTERDAEILAAKIANLRVFSDEAGKMNLSLLSVGGEMLVVSQFTLCASCAHGRRPDFFAAAKPQEAERLYLYFCDRIIAEGVRRVATGVFGADMQVSLVNDGPVTILLDSGEMKR